MESGKPALTYLLPSPFDKALKSVREALEEEGLRVQGELDVAGGIRRDLGISLAPCRILLIDCPMSLLEVVTLDTAAVSFLPLHVVVAGLGPRQTGIHLAARPGELNAAFGAVGRIQARVVRALERIATRQRPLALVH